MREIRLVLMVHASIMRDVSNVEVGHYLLTRITTYYSLLTARFLLLSSHLLVLTSHLLELYFLHLATACLPGRPQGHRPGRRGRQQGTFSEVRST